MTTLRETLAAASPKALLSIYNQLAATIPGMKPCARFSSAAAGLVRTQKLLEVVLEREEKGDVDEEFAGRAAAIVEGRDYKRNGGRLTTETEAALDAAALKPLIANPAVEVKAKTPRSAKGSKIIIKTNKEVRAQLTAAAQKLGGTRLEPVGFDNYSAFLNGFELNAERGGDTLIEFYAVKGKERQPGGVQLEVRGSDRSITVRASKRVNPK